MAKVVVKHGRESVQQLLRRFKKACENAGLMRDIKRNAYFEKPSDIKRRERVRRRREGEKRLREEGEVQTKK